LINADLILKNETYGAGQQRGYRLLLARRQFPVKLTAADKHQRMMPPKFQ
jgi:hypothetical protein